MTAVDAAVAESPYAQWQRNVVARYADRSFGARNRSGVAVERSMQG